MISLLSFAGVGSEQHSRCCGRASNKCASMSRTMTSHENTATTTKKKKKSTNDNDIHTDEYRTQTLNTSRTNKVDLLHSHSPLQSSPQANQVVTANSVDKQQPRETSCNSKPATTRRISATECTQHHIERPRTMTPRLLVVWLGLLSAILAAEHLQQIQCETTTSQQQQQQTLMENRNASQPAFDDLVAIGAISLQPASGERPTAPRGRLIDSFPYSGAEQHHQTGNHKQANKLEYIMDFMRTNKLTKFCDLLSSQEAAIKRVIEQLNEQAQFTLFVPTNEALLLMPSGQLEQIRSKPQELAQFLLAHATSELIVPKLNEQLSSLMMLPAHRTQSRWTSSGGGGGGVASNNQQLDMATTASTSLVFTLIGSPLRVTTAANIQASNQTATSGGSPTAKLDLIVNGANVISGHSYALQEPSSSNVTYAIVHLIDRALYPVPSVSLMSKLRTLGPRMARYVELAGDQQVNEALESTQRLSTLFLPNDDAFRSTPPKLVEQLEQNRTFLVQFLRAHLIDGLYYSAQLQLVVSSSAGSGSVSRWPLKLTTLSGNELELESKTLQSRTLVLVNSIPIQEPDVMALNGVLHLITRPIFERHLLDSCQCGHNNQTINSPGGAGGAFNRGATNLTEAAIYERLWPQQQRPRQPSVDSGVVYELDSLAPTGSNNDNKIHHEPVIAANHSNRASGSINWFQPRKPTTNGGGVETPANSNELERDESQIDTQTERANTGKLRSQRSGNLAVEHNNRDFYRPSSVPANLVLATGQSTGVSGAAMPPKQSVDFPSDKNTRNDPPSGNDSRANRLLQEHNRSDTSDRSNLPTNGVGDLFEAERYKVLNATTRQRMREQQRGSGPLFVYDRPLATSSTLDVAATAESPQSTTAAGKRLYSSLNSTGFTSSAGLGPTWTSVSNDQAASNRQQRLLKFQPEDARDPLPGMRINQLNASRLSSSSSANNLRPSYEIFGSSSQNSQASSAFQQLNGKTAPPPGFGGCAFYDTECKRLLGKLVRLPATRVGSHKSVQSTSLMTSATNQTSRVQVAGSSADQHLDSTFGETSGESNANHPTSTPTNQPSSQFGTLQQSKSVPLTPIQVAAKQQQQQQPFNRVHSARLSPLNQPLPPWSEEEHAGVGQHALSPPNWRAQDGDISRINSNANNRQAAHAHGFTMGLSRDTPKSAINQQVNPSAQILLVPVKLVQVQPGSTSFNATTAAAAAGQQADKSMSSGLPSSAASSGSSRLTTGQLSPPPTRVSGGGVIFNNQQYHTPTPYSVSIATTHMPPMFSQPIVGRLTNFTVLENLPALDEQGAMPPVSHQAANHHHFSVDHQQQQVVPAPARVPPSAHRKQRIQQIQIDNNGSLGSNFDLNPANGLKQARKIVRIQASPPVAVGQQLVDDFNGDISITSARLNSPSHRHQVANFSNGGLATQASNQAPNVNVVRSAPTGADQSALDFFQNRTIAEIMDDSGLRIDGQQVTFGRLKECLTEADLLSLVTQTGSSLTIFMPTDSAFQRLVQQQAAAHQRERSSSSSSASSNSLAARLLDPSRRYLVPLVARRPKDTSRGSEPNSRLLSAADVDQSASSAADRLTLDCSSSQVRQILLDHLSSRLITPKQLQADMGISSLSGRQLLLSSVPSKKIVVVDGQPVIAATRAKNGMVYVVNKFLNITHQVPNVIDLIETQPNLTTFLSYLSFSSLADRLKRETGPLTVLAPTNDAFDQLSTSARQLINSDPAALMDVLRGHIVEGAQFGKLISMRSQLRTMNADQTIEAKVIKPNVYQLDNQMTSMKLVGTAGNGVVNTIDRLIVPQWLKVSSSTPKPLDGISLLPVQSSGRSGSGGLSGLGEIDTSTGLGGLPASGSTNLNLPIITNRPVRFDQPSNIGRLTTIPTGSSNSFLLANSNTPLNNNLLDFDLPPSSSHGINRSQVLDLSATPSPFLRVANSLTSSNNPNQSRLNQADQNSPLTSPSSGNATKNMLLIEKLANLMQTRKFIKYLVRSRVSELLKPDMNYVILIPTDQALEKLPKQIIDMLERDSERLADLVNYHVLDTTFEYINTIPDGQTLNTLNEKDILFNWHRNNTILTASGAVVMGGIQEDNIALLIVDRVLYPTPGDILNIISKSPILSNFTSLVKNAGLEQQLSLAGPYTLFAPSDFAFNQLDRRDLEFLQRNKETARRFLLRHLSQPAVFTSSIALSNSTLGRQQQQQQQVRQQSVPTMIISNSLGEDLTLRQKNDYFSVNDVNFSYADVAATNGVVHVIDGLL